MSAYEVFKQVLIQPPEPPEGCTGRLVYVKRVLNNNGFVTKTEERTWEIAPKARGYTVGACYGETVTTWVKNIFKLPTGEKLYSESTPEIEFSFPPKRGTGVEIMERPAPREIQLVEFPQDNCLPPTDPSPAIPILGG